MTDTSHTEPSYNKTYLAGNVIDHSQTVPVELYVCVHVCRCMCV